MKRFFFFRVVPIRLFSCIFVSIYSIGIGFIIGICKVVVTLSVTM